MIDILTGLSGLKTAAELAGKVRETLNSRKLKPEEVSAKVIELQGLISDGRTALIDAQEQLTGKNAEISKLNQELNTFRQNQAIADELYHDGRIYWRQHTDGKRTGPYCPFCWDRDNMLVRLTFVNQGDFVGYGPRQRFDCIIHKHQFLLPYPGSVRPAGEHGIGDQ